MSTTRFILVALICASPAILLWDGLITLGLVAEIAAISLVITARTLRPGETGLLVSIIRPLIVVAAVPALWIVIQALPLRVFAHPIWKSAEVALAHPLGGAISVDPGASILALGQYLSMAAVAFLSAAVAVDRQRAEWILFALTSAVTAVALILLVHKLFFPAGWLAAGSQVEAIDCTAMGIIIAGAACIRSIERYETGHGGPQRSAAALQWTFIACCAALMICTAVLLFDATWQVLFAAGYGFFALASVMLIRRFDLGLVAITGFAVPALGVAILLVAAHPMQRGTSVSLTFAEASSSSLIALSERVLDDAPLVGTGAGTFAAIAPIYREINDPPPEPSAATSAATFAIELGQPMLWLIVAAMTATVIILLRASLQRGRDAFYPAMGGSCLISVLLLAFINSGLLGTTMALIIVATLGLAFAQSKSRSAH